jgi:hypothetical protein
MSVSEHERHRLFTWFEEHMGSERAATMMGLVPPVGWGDVATRRDLDQQIAATRHDIDLLRHDVRQLEARVDAVEASLRHDLREQMRTFGTWLFASQAAVIAAVSLLVALH